MSKNNETKKRKSGFNPNRNCYLTADDKYYCYERWDDDAKRVVTQRLEVGKDLSLELTIMLDESDHDIGDNNVITKTTITTGKNEQKESWIKKWWWAIIVQIITGVLVGIILFYLGMN